MTECEDTELLKELAEDDILDATVVISVYEPNEAQGWDSATGFRTRREGW